MLKHVEREILELTIAEKGFDPQATGDPCFILMPVPNITGNLHIGHGINLILQDLLCRQKNIEGYNVYFPPGTDHAGLMGQYTAEKRLQESGRTRQEIGRDAFNKFMASESERHTGNLIGEMQELGIKADWSHIWFTHDKQRDDYVKQVFIELFERGLVYREQSVVNWCPRCGSCVADMELKFSETQEKIYRVSLALPQARKADLIFVQPELLLGAVGVGITNQHPRYSELLGKLVKLPLTGEELRIIEVDCRNNPAFDNELRLIVPSYNFDDFELAKSKSLPIKNLYDDSGHVEYKGKLYSIEQARSLIVSELTTQDGFGSTEFGQGRAYHALCGTMVLPMAKNQWYMRMHKMEPKAAELLQNRKLFFSAKSWESGHADVLANIRSSVLPEHQKWWEGACVGVAQGYSSNKDWVISRQNWWGQPLPVLHCQDCGRIIPIKDSDNTRCDVCNSHNVVPDQDVLDVWFSCAIWPISVNPFGLKGVFADMAVMGQDIFYFWVASANMISMELYGQPAFKNMLVHGLLCDTNGKKMSKSLGNVISLQDILNEYGAETLRSFVYAIMDNNADAQWLRAGADDIKAANKTAEEVYLALDAKAKALGDADAGHVSLSQSLESLKEKISAHLEKMHSGEAYREVLKFIRSPEFNRKRFTHQQYFHFLKTIHPFHPFITNYFYKIALSGQSCLSNNRNKDLSLDQLISITKNKFEALV